MYYESAPVRFMTNSTSVLDAGGAGPKGSFFAGWISKALKKSHLSQADLARQMTLMCERSINRVAINELVNGPRRLLADEMLAIAEITGQPLPRLPSGGAAIQSQPAASTLQRDPSPANADEVPTTGPLT